MVEIDEIERRYAGLRVMEPGRQARLAASLAREGQHSPVLAVLEDEGAYVLIDGYRRVDALLSLGRDVVDLAVLPVGAAEALILTWSLESTRRRSVLEDAWLLQELVEAHGMRQVELAAQLGRSRSWVSQRLGLTGALPGAAQDAIRKGLIPAHAAMKFLVPLARANPAHCERLAAALGGDPVTDRQVERLYLAWRTADDEQRERIISEPHLFLKADEALAEPEIELDEAQKLADDLEGISGLCRKARRRVRSGVFARANVESRATAKRSWEEAKLAFEGLQNLMRAE